MNLVTHTKVMFQNTSFIIFIVIILISTRKTDMKNMSSSKFTIQDNTNSKIFQIIHFCKMRECTKFKSL